MFAILRAPKNEGYYSSKLKQHAGAEFEEYSIEVGDSNCRIICDGDSGPGVSVGGTRRNES